MSEHLKILLYCPVQMGTERVGVIVRAIWQNGWAVNWPITNPVKSVLQLRRRCVGFDNAGCVLGEGAVGRAVATKKEAKNEKSKGRADNWVAHAEKLGRSTTKLLRDSLLLFQWPFADIQWNAPKLSYFSSLVGKPWESKKFMRIKKKGL